MSGNNLLLFPIIIPFFAGLFTLIVPRLKRLKQLITVAVSGYLLYLSFFLFKMGDIEQYFFSLNLFGFRADFLLNSNHMSSMLILFTYLFGFLISIYMFKNRDWVESGENQFLTYYLWTLSAVSGIFLSQNLFFLLIFWEIVTALFFLFINLGKGKETAESARKTYVILGLADAAFLFGVAFIWAQEGFLNINLLNINTAGGVIEKVLFFTFVAAAFAKIGAWPLHTWMPDVSENAPISVMALIPASLDKLLGIYLFSLTMLKLFTVEAEILIVLMVIGVVTILIGGFMALIQNNLRRLLGYSSVSQGGYIIIGIASGNPVGIIGALFHMINHALYKSGLFMCAGAVEKEAGSLELEELGGLYKKMPVIMIANILFAFAISGIPPMNGFTSKWMIYQGLLNVKQPVFLILAIFGSAITLAYYLKVVYSVYFGGESTITERTKKVSPLMSIPTLILALLCLFFGIFATLPIGKLLLPIGFVNIGQPVKFLGDLNFINTIWNPSLATSAMLLGLVIGIIIYLVGKAFKYRSQPVYTGGERFELEERRFPGTGLYLTILDIPLLGQYLKDRIKGDYDGYNIVKMIGWETIIKKLKNMHNGILSTYLSWCIIGLMIIIFLLMAG